MKENYNLNEQGLKRTYQVVLRNFKYFPIWYKQNNTHKTYKPRNNLEKKIE